MIVTTTDTLEGYKITGYLGVFFESYHSEFPDIVYESLIKKAEQCGADAIIGFKLDNCPFSEVDLEFNNHITPVLIAYGTFVTVEKV